MGLIGKGTEIFFPGTQVFSGAAPGAYTDLDLSAVVGTRVVFVLLSLAKTATTAATNYFFRTNGDAKNQPLNSVFSSQHDNTNTSRVVICCITDASGIVEWLGSNNDAVVVSVLAYMV